MLYVMNIAPGAERGQEMTYLSPQGAIVHIGNYCMETAYTATIRERLMGVMEETGLKVFVV